MSRCAGFSPGTPREGAPILRGDLLNGSDERPGSRACLPAWATRRESAPGGGSHFRRPVAVFLGNRRHLKKERGKRNKKQQLMVHIDLRRCNRPAPLKCLPYSKSTGQAALPSSRPYPRESASGFICCGPCTGGLQSAGICGILRAWNVHFDCAYCRVSCCPQPLQPTPSPPPRAPASALRLGADLPEAWPILACCSGWRSTGSPSIASRARAWEGWWALFTLPVRAPRNARPGPADSLG